MLFFGCCCIMGVCPEKSIFVIEINNLEITPLIFGVISV